MSRKVAALLCLLAFLAGTRVHTYGTAGGTMNAGIYVNYWVTDGADECHTVGYEYKGQPGPGWFKDMC